MMSDDIDWLHSRRGVCKVDLYSPVGQRDQDRKVICFVDVSTLNVEDKDCKDATGSSSDGDLSLGNLEEKEIIVIKDTEKQDQSKTEGSVCLFKQAPSDPISVFNWLLNDLQKYALGFQHALSPSASSCKHKVGETKDEEHQMHSGNCYSVYADQLNLNYLTNEPQSLRVEMTAAKNTNNNQSPSSPPAKSSSGQRAVISPDGECCMDDLSYYVNRLSSLVIQMARKEIKDKLEGGSKCLHHSMYPPTGDKGKNSPRSAVSKIASEMVHDAMEVSSSEMRGPGEDCKEGGRKTFLYSELSNKNKCGEKQMCQRDSKEFADSISKGLMVYANQVASDMMVSVMKTLKVHSGKPIPACVVLKRVLLKHTKEIVSDLIDSCMKNLHNITGVLMTDSDFVSAVKRNLFNHGKQNAADIMEAMLKRLVSALLGEKRETKSQSLSYASLKAGSQDPKCKNQSLEFSAVKAEMKGKDKCKAKTDPCKSLTSAEKVSEHILKESLTMWNQKQGNQGKVACAKACANKEEKREKISPSTDSLAKDLIVSALMLIQYHLTQQAKCKDTCEEECPSSSVNYVAQSTQFEKCGGAQTAKAVSMKHVESRGNPAPSTSAAAKETPQPDCQKLDMSNIVLTLIQKLLNESPFSCEELCEGENKRSEPKIAKPSCMSKRSDRVEEQQCQENQDLDFLSGMKQVNRQFIDQLVESVMKLCLIMAKYSSNGAALAELEEQAALAGNSNFSGLKCGHDGAMSQGFDTSGPEVIVNNQCSTSNLQKQLQAVLQWIAASQFNVPMLYFMGDDDGQLEKLPEVSAKAAEKGYSVGDLLQEVMKFAKERQLDEAVGNMARKQLLDWLLTNL
ncbi:A-kinase anchor protein 4 [Otolemur garnettii]|nr:A-kinase anchor protein 4 [Otolemur garnettii]